MRLMSRLDALERRLAPAAPARWVRIVQDVGQSREEAIAAYEGENGPVGDASLIVREIVV